VYHSTEINCETPTDYRHLTDIPYESPNLGFRSIVDWNIEPRLQALGDNRDCYSTTHRTCLHERQPACCTLPWDGFLHEWEVAWSCGHVTLQSHSG